MKNETWNLGITKSKFKIPPKYVSYAEISPYHGHHHNLTTTSIDIAPATTTTTATTTVFTTHDYNSITCT